MDQATAQRISVLKLRLLAPGKLESYSLRDGRRVDDRVHDTARSVEGFHRRGKTLLNSHPTNVFEPITGTRWRPTKTVLHGRDL